MGTQKHEVIFCVDTEMSQGFVMDKNLASRRHKLLDADVIIDRHTKHVFHHGKPFNSACKHMSASDEFERSMALARVRHWFSEQCHARLRCPLPNEAFNRWIQVN